MPRLIICAILALCSLARGAEIEQRLQAIRQRLPDFDARLAQLRGRGEDVAYPLVTYTVLDNFTAMGLEDLKISVPVGWGFMGVSGCNASYEPVADAHSGKVAAKLTHKSPMAPNVYGMLENADGVTLKAGKPYTFSLWAKCRQPGGVAMTLNAAWSERLAIESTGGQWKRFSKTFTPAPGDVNFQPRVITQDVTDGVIIDDLCVVEGGAAEAGKNLMPNGSFEHSWSEHRNEREIGDMEAMTARLDRHLADALSGKIKLPRVPRWDGKSRPTISGPSFLAADGRPIFFVGYGHFQQVRNDIERFPAYGVNIVQHGELGPAQVFPRDENTPDDAALDRLIDELDRAAKAGVAVDFLISPHYVPEWVWTRWPHLRKARADFIPWSIYAPEGRALVKRFCDYVIPKIKDKPALFSICLSNEPNNAQEPDEFAIAAWRAWLKTRHGDIATLNMRWNTKYASFDEVPPVNPLASGPEPRPGAAWCDFVRWNQEYFADFHAFLAKCVKDVAPEIPVHIKATTWHLYRAENIRYGDDPTLLDAVSDINGNDSVNLWSFKERGGDLIERGTTEFAQGWRENAIGYALQRSTKDAPVFNSENHLIFDRETRYVDPAHIRAGLWMGAIHGQSATTLWVWEREKSNPRGDLAGSIMERPACAEALGIACHDLNRAAREITAIQNAPPDIEILQSNTAAAWDGAKYHEALIKMFTELSFTGLKIGFISERQLEQGILPRTTRVYATNCVHVSDAAVATLRKYQWTIITRGKDCFAKNEYDQPRAAAAMPPTGKAINFPPEVLVVGAADKVQWQIGKLESALIVNVYNASHDPQTVRLSCDATDVLTGKTLNYGQRFTLQPLGVRLFRCEKRAK